MSKTLKRLSILIFLFSTFSVCEAWSQNQEGSSAYYHQVGLFVGKVLPNGIGAEDEIFSQSGIRYSMPAGKKTGGYYDFSFFGSNSAGVEWQGLAAGVSMHIPVETLMAHAGLGLDFTNFKTETSDGRVGGGHFIGGVMSRMGGNALLRFDMKLNSKPGTSLFFGVGIVIELDDLGSSSGND